MYSNFYALLKNPGTLNIQRIFRQEGNLKLQALNFNRNKRKSGDSRNYFGIYDIASFVFKSL